MHGLPTWVEVFLGISWRVNLCPENGLFGVEAAIISVFFVFFDFGRGRPSLTLAKLGAELNLVAGEIRHVSESIGF